MRRPQTKLVFILGAWRVLRRRPPTDPRAARRYLKILDEMGEQFFTRGFEFPRLRWMHADQA